MKFDHLLLSTVICVCGALGPVSAQENANSVVPNEDVAIVMEAAPDVIEAFDCRDHDAVLNRMIGKDTAELFAIREICANQFVVAAQKMSDMRNEIDAFDVITAQWEVELTALNVLQRDLEGGGRVHSAVQQMATEIEALEDLVELQADTNPEEAERNRGKLRDQRRVFEESKQALANAKKIVDENLSRLRASLPDLAIRLRIDELTDLNGLLGNMVETTNTAIESADLQMNKIPRGSETE